MLCQVDPTAEPGDANAPAPQPSQVAFREYLPHAPLSHAALAAEIALAITFNGLSQAVMMVSPGNLEDFIRGFSLSNAIIDSVDEIYDIRLSHFDQACQADVQISSRAFWALKDHRRQMAGTSGCGICGVEALEQALPQLDILQPCALPPAAHFDGIRQRIEQAQQLARSSGALHAALYFDANGKALLCREDIGRHNALDKLIGALHLAEVDARQGFVVVTSRCSLELIHKAVRARLGTLVSLSAPTALTVRWALKHRLNLIHVPHRNAPRIYSPIQELSP
ncbi:MULTISPECIES: formate dehydrogenase accessory sulfurtransferase FdhD [Pseudomonas]|uniref:Sulfur carrier protein FdhD n=2 Tax=Pseudomonas TaxID=286 RepID=A0AA94JFC2_9PSED|nr:MULTISPECIES: formate dehydrogenase accessory sulfurtransferase FdhD [Pseudomonas]MBT9268295.1 formate dehydrogenase accessory sulfurtransferase FdhD [Pseudomonas sp. MG-9]RVD74340.1 formate dehydrogenase [Pseudomonas koreensis]WDR37677.1 formate dehydrogenase accessory sulfurtransferase FdhD [Pseudomonas serboccidentalis]